MSVRERLKPVLDRLEVNFSSPENRYVNVTKLIDQFSKEDYLPRLTHSYKEAKKGPRKKEEFKDNLTAFLFLKNRERYQKENYDLGKEEREIKAVVDLLNGNHIHMGTGEGKSTVILPIASIIDAMTSEKQTANLVTTDETLLSELRENAGYF